MMRMDDKKGHGMMDQRHMKEMMQQMMGGMLPPGIRPQDLPEPESLGATLLSTYCSQCHNLPSARNLSRLLNGERSRKQVSILDHFCPLHLQQAEI